MQFLKSEKYDRQFVIDNMMGPNSLKLIEELTLKFDLRPAMRVMDLGCGKGLTAVFLAKEYGVQVFATDLWIEATENYRRFQEMGLDDLIIPIHTDILQSPFAEHYFDAVISVDAFHYFGRDAEVIDTKIAPLVKPGGLIALVVPGFKQDLHDNLPPEILLSWSAEDMDTIHSCAWWEKLFSQAKTVSIEQIGELECCDECWNDWLKSNNEYAVNDRRAMEAGAGKYMNMIYILATKK